MLSIGKTRAREWVGDGDERGRSPEHVAVETESSIGGMKSEE